MVIYGRYKCTVAKLITLHNSKVFRFISINMTNSFSNKTGSLDINGICILHNIMWPTIFVR